MHDVGNVFINESQEVVTRSGPVRSAILTLQEGFVFTIEPGIYFIPSLLEDFKQNSPFKDSIDWTSIESLMACGGLRIEDDLVVTQDGYENLTRGQEDCV